VSSTTIILVRHGESNVTVQRVLGGELSCTGLSPLGVRQAEALRARIERGAEPAIDAVVASTMPRARETAEIVLPALGDVPFETRSDLVEQRPGEADGLTFDEFRVRYPVIDWRADPDVPLSPGGESINQFHARVRTALDEVREAYAGRTVMVVCHGGVIDVTFREFLGFHPSAPLDLWALNTSLTEFLHRPDVDRWVLRRFNDSAHLADLPASTLG
jgi:probable phosphoglycerate mutase